MSDKSEYEIRHPDQAIVLASTVVVYKKGEETSGMEAEDGTTLSLVHITRTEPLETPKNPAAN